jgi:LmbE family N-acetylglucosaminyl deacetylase
VSHIFYSFPSPKTFSVSSIYSKVVSPSKFFVMFAHQKSMQKLGNETLLYPSAQVYDWGSTLVVSPHPNSEVLGCGGAMALLRQMGFRVHVLFVSDGSPTGSLDGHSEEDRLDQSSNMEVVELIGKIGVSNDATIFLNLRENLIPMREQPGFEEAVRLCLNELETFQPDAILLPFLDQGNRDVQATWQIIRQAARRSYYPIRMVEYLLWSWSTKNPADNISTENPKTWRLDIKEVMDIKLNALDNQRQGQYPFPWRNSSQEMLLHQTNPWELYFEYTSEDIG